MVRIPNNIKYNCTVYFVRCHILWLNKTTDPILFEVYDVRSGGSCWPAGCSMSPVLLSHALVRGSPLVHSRAARLGDYTPDLERHHVLVGLAGPGLPRLVPRPLVMSNSY